MTKISLFFILLILCPVVIRAVEDVIDLDTKDQSSHESKKEEIKIKTLLNRLKAFGKCLWNGGLCAASLYMMYSHFKHVKKRYQTNFVQNVEDVFNEPGDHESPEYFDALADAHYHVRINPMIYCAWIMVSGILIYGNYKYKTVQNMSKYFKEAVA